MITEVSGAPNALLELCCAPPHKEQYASGEGLQLSTVNNPSLVDLQSQLNSEGISAAEHYQVKTSRTTSSVPCEYIEEKSHGFDRS
jgi:hypothetical protein